VDAQPSFAFLSGGILLGAVGGETRRTRALSGWIRQRPRNGTTPRAGTRLTVVDRAATVNAERGPRRPRSPRRTPG
jgi:hypothetical protein